MDVDSAVAKLDQLYPTRNWVNQCERLCWNLSWIAQGLPTRPEPQGYANANIARRASTVLPGPVSNAGPGDTLWYEYGVLGHDGIATNNGAVLMATGKTSGLQILRDYGQGIKLVVASSYAGYLGRAVRHGNHPDFDLTYNPPTPPPSGTTFETLYGGRDWDWTEPVGELAIRVQKALKARGRYNGPDDGQFGYYTRLGIQQTLKTSGIFIGQLDGHPERGGAYGVQKYGAKFGDYLSRGGVIDGRPRNLSWDAFALGLERP